MPANPATSYCLCSRRSLHSSKLRGLLGRNRRLVRSLCIEISGEHHTMLVHVAAPLERFLRSGQITHRSYREES